MGRFLVSQIVEIPRQKKAEGKYKYQLCKCPNAGARLAPRRKIKANGRSLCQMPRLCCKIKIPALTITNAMPNHQISLIPNFATAFTPSCAQFRIDTRGVPPNGLPSTTHRTPKYASNTIQTTANPRCACTVFHALRYATRAASAMGRETAISLDEKASALQAASPNSAPVEPRCMYFKNKINALR